MRGVTVELKTSILLSGFAVTSIPWYPVTVVIPLSISSCER